MTRDLKRKLVANLIPAMVVPVARVGVDHYFQNRMLEKRQNHEIELAERRAEAVSALAGEPVSQTMPRNGSYPRSPQVYDALDRLRRDTDCGFCSSAAGALMDQDRETAAEGLEELQQYHNYLEDARAEGMPPEQIEADVEHIVGGWEVVPRVVGGVA